MAMFTSGEWLSPGSSSSWRIEPDDVHYGDREPGELDLAVESFIEEESSVANPDRHRVGYLLDLHLAPSGRMLCGSKSAFRHAYPTNAPIFNANMFVLEHGLLVKVWHGDLDLTVDEGRLVRIASVCQQTLLILWEKDGRFAGRDREPRLHDVALRIEPDGSTMLDEDQFWRADDGTIRSQPEPSARAGGGHQHEQELEPALVLDMLVRFLARTEPRRL